MYRKNERDICVGSRVRACQTGSVLRQWNWTSSLTGHVHTSQWNEQKRKVFCHREWTLHLFAESTMAKMLRCLCLFHYALWHKDSSTIIDIGPTWRWMLSFTPPPLHCRGNSPRYPLDRTLGGSHSWSGQCGEEKNLFPLPGIEPVAIPTELSRLLFRMRSLRMFVILAKG
jgi:hypothetical protein